MEDYTAVFDISSDEEPAGDDDYSWLTNILRDDVDDSDDVVMVSEIKSKTSKVTARDNEDDDDCVVLDGDPDKPVAVDDDKADDGDDLVIVSQKGQIACRDYPHPRHLCAKFIFSSTPHEKHCDMCHCYICDIPAPCLRWGTGVSNIDHCHATKKVESWKSKRKTFRLEKDAPLTVQVPDTPLPLPQLNQTPVHDINQLPQNQVSRSRPAIIRGCSSPPRLTIPNVISQFRSRQSGPVFCRNRVPIRSVSRPQMLRVHNNGIRNPGMFKRAGIVSVGGSEVNHFVDGSSNNIKNAYGSLPAPQATSNDWIDVPWGPSMNHDSFTCQSTSQSGSGSVFMSAVPPQPQAYSQLLPQQLVYSHPMAQQPVYSHPMAQQPVYSQPIPAPQLYSQPIPAPQLYSQPNPAPQLYSQPIPQPQAYTQHSPLANEGQNVNELGNQMENSTGPDFSEFDELVSKTSQSNQPPQVENCQLPRAGCKNDPSPAEEFNLPCNGSSKLPYNYSGFENWYPDSHYGQVSEVYVPSDLDALTSDPAAFEAGWSYTSLEDLLWCSSILPMKCTHCPIG